MRGKLLGADERLVIVTDKGERIALGREDGADVYEAFDMWTATNERSGLERAAWNQVETDAATYLETIDREDAEVETVERETIPTDDPTPTAANATPQPTTTVETSTQRNVRVFGVVQTGNLDATPQYACEHGCRTYVGTVPTGHVCMKPEMVIHDGRMYCDEHRPAESYPTPRGWGKVETATGDTPAPKSYIIVAHMPACSAVLFVNPALERHHQVTIHLEDTRQACEWYARGFCAGTGFPRIENRGSIDLPAGNPAKAFAERILGAQR